MAQTGAIIAAIYATIEDTVNVVGKVILETLPKDDKVEIVEEGKTYISLKDFDQKLSFSDAGDYKEYAEGVKEYGLTLAQAYALVWQDDETGNVDHETFASAILYITVLTDLVFQGKLALEVVQTKKLYISWKETKVSLTEEGETEAKEETARHEKAKEEKKEDYAGNERYLEYALYDLQKRLDKKKKTNTSFSSYAADCGMGQQPGKALKRIMASLEARQIVSSERKKKWLGMSHKTVYPTHDPAVEEKLRAGLRAALDEFSKTGKITDTYLRLLLVFAYRADKDAWGHTFAKSLCTVEERKDKKNAKDVYKQLKEFNNASKEL